MTFVIPMRRGGFTLIEVLVTISIILVLAGLTLGGLRASRSDEEGARAAARIVMLMEYGAGVARTGGESVYFVVAGPTVWPERDAMGAYTLMRDPAKPERLRPWARLPRELVFGPLEEGASGFDLLAHPPVRRFTEGTVEDAVAGEGLALVEIDSEGRFRVGPDRRMIGSALSLRRGEWVRAGTEWRFFQEGGAVGDAEGEVGGEKGKDGGRVRIRFRPLTGVAAWERVLP